MHLQAVTFNEMQVFHFPWDSLLYSLSPPSALLINMCSRSKKNEIKLFTQTLSCTRVRVLLSIGSPENTFPQPPLEHCQTLQSRHPHPSLPITRLNIPLAMACVLSNALGQPVPSFGQTGRLGLVAQYVPAEVDSSECKALSVVVLQ